LTHVVGVLLADPVWRYAEVLTVLLVAYALLTGSPAPRWVVPAALGVLLIDAVRTLPAPPPADGSGFGWRLEITMTEYRPTVIDMTVGFTHGLSLSWAAVLVAGVLMVVWRRGGWRRSTVTAAAASGVLVVGYAVARVVDIGMDVDAQWNSDFDAKASEAVAAAGLAVLAPVVLALLALALAAALAGHGRRLAAAGAALLAAAALPYVDAASTRCPNCRTGASTPLYLPGPPSPLRWRCHNLSRRSPRRWS
jgi:hypothetical protein